MIVKTLSAYDRQSLHDHEQMDAERGDPKDLVVIMHGWGARACMMTRPAHHQWYSHDGDSCSRSIGHSRQSVDNVLADYPYLERADVLAAHEYAAGLTQKRAQGVRVRS
jgi:hypothetical protein